MKRAVRLLGFLALAVALPACGIGGNGTLTPTVAPQVPQNLGAKTGNHSVTLSWVGSPAATGYIVKRSAVPGGPYAALPGGSVAGTSFVDLGLVNHVPFYYVVSATNSFGESPDSTEVPGIAALRASQLSGGSNHSLALLQDGTVWGWGQNDVGQLGNGLNSESNVPVRALGLPAIATISANGGSNLALETGGRVWSWGDNKYGQLGNGSTGGSSPVPALAMTSSGLPLCSAVSGSWEHAIALGRDGTVWTWGLNDDFKLGRVSGPTGIPGQVSLPAGIPGVLDVSAGGPNSMLLSSDGTAWCWGKNNHGQLGDPAVVAASSMTPVQVFHLTGVTAVAAGGEFNLALRQDGTVWSWGINNLGQLGNGVGNGTVENPPGFSPLAAPVLLNTGAPLAGIVAIDAQSAHSLALRNDGTVWAWGSNGSGELGNPLIDLYSPYAVQVSGLVGQTVVAAGHAHAHSASADGTVWGWGQNAKSQLATGTSLRQGLAIQLPNLTSVTMIAAGGSPDPIDRPYGGLISYGSGHGISLASTGQVWTWGNNADEQLGNNVSNGIFPVPQLVIQSGPATLNSVTAVAGGGRHGLAVSGATAWAWGDRSSGQLGNGIIGGTSPVAVQVLTAPATPLPGVISVAAGENYSLALLSNNTVWAWGNNGTGQLGTGAAGGPSPFATQVQTGTGPLINVVAISAGFNHSLALLSDNTVWAWGDNSYGQLGDPLVVSSYSAVAVQVKVLGPPLAPLTGIASISAGSWHNLARTSTGAVWAWGDDTFAQLGSDPAITQVYGAKTYLNNSYPNHPTDVRWSAAAVPVVDAAGAPLTAVVAVSAGEFHSLAIRNDLNDPAQQSVWAWGDSTTGAVGNADAIIFSPPPGLPYNNEFITPFSPVPVPVQHSVPTGLAILRGITGISCAGYTSFLLSGDGTVWGCGSNNFSQLGSTTSVSVSVPVTIDP